MLKKQVKNVILFFCLLFISILFLLVSAIPQFVSRWDEFPWITLITDRELLPALIIVLLGLSVFIISFIFCIKVINKSVKILKDSEYQEFIELDRSGKGCDTVIYGYHVPIATINLFYSANGKISKLVEKQGIEPLLARLRQLTYRSELINDVINCIAALLLSLVTAYITGEEIYNFSSLDVIFTMVTVGVCVSSVFLRPVLVNRFQSKYEIDIRKYEIQIIEQFLLDYNKKLNLLNVDHCGKKERLSKIRKLQKEMELTKGRFKKKKIREKIKILENGESLSKKTTVSK